MGRTSDEEAETSTKTYRCDGSKERPLKKARYVWQIKGKYNLRNSKREDSAKLYTADETNNIKPEAGTAGDPTVGEEMKEEPASTGSEEQSPMECEYVNPWQLQKWQARQVARCFVDNTINRVLEDMGFIPLPVDADDLMENFTAGLHTDDDSTVEDAAVMMAIHSHGLQRAVAGIRAKEAKTCACKSSLNSVQIKKKNPDLVEASNSQREERIQNNQNNNSLDIKTEQNDEITCDEDENMEDRSSEHTDFLNKAVAVAIQKKGLSTLVGVDYG